MIEAMKTLSSQYPRYGYRRIRIFLRRDGHELGIHRTHRLWRQAGLQRPHRRPRRRIATGRPRPLRPVNANFALAYDFVFDATAAGKDHRDYLLELIGPQRRIETRTQDDDWNHGEDPERYPIDTGRLRQVIEVATLEAGWGRPMPKAKWTGVGRDLHVRHVCRRGCTGGG